MRLENNVLLQLQLAHETLVATGDVYFLPHDFVLTARDADPHSHPCLVALVDRGRAFMVLGTSGCASGPALVVEVGETDLVKRTEFDFRTTFVLPLTDLVANGDPKGRLADARVAEIRIRALESHNPAVKRLARMMH